MTSQQASAREVNKMAGGRIYKDGDTDTSPSRRPKPEDLGTGMLSKTASIIEQRRARECQILGGTYDYNSGTCRMPNGQ